MKKSFKHGNNGDFSKERMTQLFFRPAFHVSVLVVLALIAYSNSFHGAFVFDDESSIVTNRVVHGLGSFFSNGAGYSYNPRRFIGYLSFALNYQLGGLEMTGYHAVNLAIHIINALIIYVLVRVTLRTPIFTAECMDNPSPGPGSNLIPFFAALLFVVHPIQTEAVTYTVQRLTSLMTLFYLLSLYLYVRTRLLVESGGTGWKVAAFSLLSLSSAVLAMKIKENAFTLPFIAILYEFCFFRGPWQKRVGCLSPLLATSLIIPLSLINIHKPVGELLSDVNKTTIVESTLSRWDYLCTQFRVIVTYLRLLILPVRQNLDYDYPTYHSLFTPPVFLSFLLLLSLFGIAVYLMISSSMFNVQRPMTTHQTSVFNLQTKRLISFGIFWFFITLSVESSIIPIVDVIFEHRLYLPSVGLFISVVALCTSLVEQYRRRLPKTGGVMSGAAAVAVLILTGATYARNFVWQDNLTLWTDVVANSPVKIRPLNNLGAAFNDSGRPDEAAAVLEKAIAVKPDHPEAYYNLGRTYHVYRRDYVAARDLYLRAIMLKPDYTDAYINLGGVYNKMGDYAEAVKVLQGAKETTIKERPEFYFNMGVAHVSLGEVDVAYSELHMLQQLNPPLAQQLLDFIHAKAGHRN